MLDAIRTDLRHYSRYCYGGKPLWRVLPRILLAHPAAAGVIWYRFGSAAWRSRWPVLRELLKLIYLLVLPLARMYSGVQIHPRTPIGPGLVILHFGGVIITEQCRIGPNCVLHHNVSLVTMRSDRGATIGSNFYAGTGAIVIGAVRIEDHVTAGAGCVITKSVPQDAVVAGVPARIIRFRDPREDPAENRTLPPHEVGYLSPTGESAPDEDIEHFLTR